MRNRGRAYWEQIVRDFEASGQTQVVFARKRKVGLSSLQRWRSRLVAEDGRGEPGFVELKTSAEPTVSISLSDNVAIHLGAAAEPALIAAVAQRVAVGR